MTKDYEYDVFLSHNAKDKPRVRRLAKKLSGLGLRVWFDETVIDPGDDIYLAVERGLAGARVLVLCMSENAFGSNWVSLERSTVLFRDPTNEGRRFVPLLLEDCELPDTLLRYKYIDYRKETKPALSALLSACSSPGEPKKTSGVGQSRVRLPKPVTEARTPRATAVSKRASRKKNLPLKSKIETEITWARFLAISPSGERLAICSDRSGATLWNLVKKRKSGA